MTRVRYVALCVEKRREIVHMIFGENVERSEIRRREESKTCESGRAIKAK